MNIVEVQHVTKKFSNHIALKDLSLAIPKGSIFGLLGPNGAGKTTLIRMLNQITVPDSGVILYQGRPLQREDIETVGYLPEERGLYKKMKISDQVIYLARLKGLPMDVATKRLQF
ncbi:MAG: ATP-binding cassette domain-containing protein, partial [Bacteroidales bacterium]|nr:ATP-binding cassette domain-containing protein [Bacteroidales bacterium]